MRFPFPAGRDTRPVLFVLHHERSCPGFLGKALRAKGHILDVRRPRFGDPLPSTLASHAGAVILGGPMCANDPDDWLRREIEWIGVPLREGRPLLGICLGAQMIAAHLGARVSPHHEGRAQIGHYRIDMTDLGRATVGTPPGSRVLQWHRDVFRVPDGANLLAYDDHGIQAFSYGPSALALQFHPEATPEIVTRWVAEDAEAAALPGAREWGSILSTHREYAPKADRWVEGIVDGWLGRDTLARPASRWWATTVVERPQLDA